MTTITDIDPTTDADAVAASYLAAFDAALASGDPDALMPLLEPEAWWRDLLAITGDLRTAHGQTEIAALLDGDLARSGICVEGLVDSFQPRLEDNGVESWLEALFSFSTQVGSGRGIVRLRPDGDGAWRAWTVLTALEALADRPDARGPRRPQGVDHGTDRGPNWLESRQKSTATAGESDIVIVGAGQGGLALAARLKQLGIRSLIVERHGRVGDSWRMRYESLVLHDPIWYDHLPYLSFPDTWPVFTPKDKLGGWLESYAELMELDVWTATTVVGGEYHDAEGRWALLLRRADGSEQTINPRHVVLATGGIGEPFIPDLPGRMEFAGTVLHSTEFVSGRDFTGQRAVVVGAGNSGHDIAHDLYSNGAETTLVQRSSTCVVTSDQWIRHIYAPLFVEGGPPTDEADLRLAGFPFALLTQFHQRATQRMREADGELLAALEKRGFQLSFGSDDSGLFIMTLRGEGGFYIDVGCSRLIADGEIHLAQGAGLVGFTETAAVLEDGRELPADVVILATGFENMRDTARRILGEEISSRTNEVWGLDDEGELRGVWRPTGHPGLWFMAGNLQMTRFYSQYLALTLALTLDGRSG